MNPQTNQRNGQLQRTDNLTVPLNPRELVKMFQLLIKKETKLTKNHGAASKQCYAHRHKQTKTKFIKKSIKAAQILATTEKSTLE